VSLEDDLKGVKETVENHGERIGILEKDNIYIKEKLNSISAQMVDTKDEVTDLKSAVTRLETTVLTTNNSILTTLTQVVTNTSNNNTQIVTTNSNNRTQILLKVLGVVSAILAGYLMSKFGITVTI
jgi:chromosome segregation ATPase